MPNISFIARDGIVVPFVATKPRDESSLYINVVDDQSGDVLLRVELRHKTAGISFSHKSSDGWSKKQIHDLAIEKQNKILLSVQKNKFLIDFNGSVFEYDLTRDIVGREIRIFCNFDFISTGSDLSSDQHFARRWPFLLSYETRPWLTSQMSNLPQMISQKAGLSAIIAFDGDEKLLAGIVAKIHDSVDELIIAVYESSSVNVGFFNELQSKYFNVSYQVVQYFYSDNDEDRDRAYFLNGLFEKCKFQNIFFLSPYDDPQKAISCIRENRMRTREDHFAVVEIDHKSDAVSILGFSLRKSTYVVDAEAQHLTLPDDDIAARNMVSVPSTGLSGSVNWSVRLDEKVTAEGSCKKVPAVSLRNVLDSYRPTAGPRIVCMIVSCEINRNKQDAIRQTWLKDLKTANIEYVFVEGNPSIDGSVLLGDRLFVSCPDTYEYLSHKIYRSIEAIRERFNPDYIFKIDDDCVCNVQKLLELDLNRYEYIGTNIIRGKNATYDWHKKSLSNKQLSDILYKAKSDVRWFDGQGGYFLGPKAIDIISKMDLLTFSHMYEDYAVGRALHGKVDMPEFISCHFTSIRDSDIHWEEDYRNTIVSDVHSLERMQAVQQLFDQENQRAAALRNGINVVIS
ncbi:hypothetical protein [Labrenzia sp. CE80]|uniref:hypothetical protein n=1 Tax=Labrenzia sp. CE80 TaxID=1788986 RepID=UPI00129A4868|nr:hypothetical protein [Labrenzia sp. CE80]